MKNTSVLFASLVLAVSCSKIQKFEDKTTSMEKTTKDMSSTTHSMSETTQDMKATTDTMYKQIRSKEAEDTRNKKFTILNDKTKDIGEKFAAAAIFYKSFEFQLWTATGNDDQHAREALFLDAANEFTRRMVDIHSKIEVNKMDPTSLGKNQSNEKAFYALAAAAHYNHHFQDQLVEKKKSVVKVSFYDILKEALLKDSRGEALADYHEILVSGANKQIAIDLIKARVDMLSALALKNLTDKSNMSLGQKAKGLLFKISGGKLGSIDLPETFETSNTATKHLATTYLDAAVKARNFLKEIGVEKDLQKTLLSAYKHLEIESESEKDEKEKTEIKTLIEELLAE